MNRTLCMTTPARKEYRRQSGVRLLISECSGQSCKFFLSLSLHFCFKKSALRTVINQVINRTWCAVHRLSAWFDSPCPTESVPNTFFLCGSASRKMHTQHCSHPGHELDMVCGTQPLCMPFIEGSIQRQLGVRLPVSDHESTVSRAFFVSGPTSRNAYSELFSTRSQIRHRVRYTASFFG
jgi:hypothetical protein